MGSQKCLARGKYMCWTLFEHFYGNKTLLLGGHLPTRHIRFQTCLAEGEVPVLDTL